MTRPEAAALIRAMVATTGQASRFDTKAVDAMINAYLALLADLDYVDCNAAVRVLLAADSRWVPPVSEIRRVVLELAKGPVKAGAEAWGDIAKLGTYRNREAMDLVDPVVLELCRQFGWIQWRTLFRNGEDIEQWHVVRGDNESADRARFIDAYEQSARQERRELQVPLLREARERRERGEVFSAGDLVAGLLAQVKGVPSGEEE